MKKVISLALALILLLSLAGLVACNGGDTADNGATPADENGAPSGSAGLTWNDMPLYSGANQVQKGNWAIPADEEGWAEVEWRYYETDDSADEVAAFYKSQMTAKGWEEMLWMDAEGVAWAYYSKNDEKDGAMFWCGEEEGDTFFALMRAAQ